MALYIKIPHHFTEEDALKRTKKLLQETKKEYSDEIKNLKESWKANKGAFSFTIRGYDLSGTIVVSTKNVEINGELPGMLSFFKGKIEKIIKERAQEVMKD
jgi:hypothetical protein